MYLIFAIKLFNKIIEASNIDAFYFVAGRNVCYNLSESRDRMKKKVIKTLKIIGILLLVAIILFIKFILIPALDIEANNYQNVLEYGEIINFTFPKTGDCFIENMKYSNLHPNDYFNASWFKQLP